MDDDNDPNRESDEENEDEEMEDVNEPDHDVDQDIDAGGDEDEDDEGDGDEDNDNDNEDEEEEDQNDSGQERQQKPPMVPTSPSPRASAARSPGATATSFIPPVRPEALNAMAYDIVPTMAAPQSTSINAITATPDMRWVFTGGTDGYVRMFNWVETANGKVPLTVAQKHPFVDSVMKAGSLVTYWENEEHSVRASPAQADDTKWLSPVYALAVQHQALWLLSGLESGGINLQTCRHQAGTRITTLKEHTSAVSVLALSQDETNFLSGSWDKSIHDWDLQSGKVKRSYKGSGGQISAIEIRPMSDAPVPEVSNSLPHLSNGTFSSNNADRPLINGGSLNGFGRRDTAATEGEEDVIGSPNASLFGDGDTGSLFGEGGGGAGGGGNTFGNDDDDLTRALENEMQDTEQDAPGEADTEMSGIGNGGPVQSPTPAGPVPQEDALPPPGQSPSDQTSATVDAEQPSDPPEKPLDVITNGLPHSDEPLTAPPTNEDQRPSPADLPPQSESTFLDAAQDGTLRIWDRRVAQPVATILPFGPTPPWCTGACWSPDGNFFYAGRRNCTVDEYSIHHLGSKRSEPNRIFRFQPGSGPVYAVRAMPNKKHLICASNDILRIYDLAQAETRHRAVPFTIVPGHRGGVISAIHVDPSCRFMLSAAGNRGWEGGSTEVLLGYEIGIPG